MKHLTSLLMILVLAVSFTTSAFADRTLIIPDLPKQPYRYGVGAYEGVVAHSTATPEAPAINIQKYESHTWRSAFVHYAVDWNETIKIADTKYIAYGAGPGASYSVIRQLNKPESYKVWGEKDGWLNLGGNHWVYNNPSYIKFEKKESVNPIVGKRVVSKVDNLRFYDSPSWQDKDVAGSLDAGLGFTIDTKVDVNGSLQYKVHNSKGKTYYVTASEAFVYVK
ncbi:hypothetical protein [Bacillus pseudomycoides]|uniref:hypothetical protein n=1 Tax=Bacillus pseudomycoides TaxID=64104 RepID=UPI001155D144|nr:hypothetical protein [Bacillus pseudomycoides]